MARRELGPASLAVVQAIDALPEGAWLVACSGGTDSLALAWGAQRVAAKRGTPCRAVVVDHGLQKGSAVIAAEAVEHLAELGLDAVVAKADVRRTNDGIEADARRARYKAFNSVVMPSEIVLLGHTLDDQAETVLLGLARGSGIRSLAGMATARGRYRRPLLGLERATTRACCEELGLQPWKDPMNTDRRFARVRIRESVLPLMEKEIGPGIKQALARTAQAARADADLLDKLAAEAISNSTAINFDGIRAHWLGELSAPIRSRVLLEWLRMQGATDVASVHITAVDALVTAWSGQQGIDIPGGTVVRREGWLRWVPR